MRWGKMLRLRLRSLVARTRVERELDEELRFHLEKQVEQNVAAGMNREEALWTARREFGMPEPLKEECRDVRGVRVLEEMARDIRHGWRQLLRHRGFTAVVVLTIALGIGATVSMFSVVNRVLLEPLPYRNADRLAAFWQSAPQQGLPKYTLSQFNVTYYREHVAAFEQLAAYSSGSFTVTGHRTPERLRGAVVSQNYFDVFGVRPLLGRFILPREDRPGSNHVVVLSHGLWERRFQSSRDVIGTQVRIDNKAMTVVGVAPRWFGFPADAELWTPIGLDPTNTGTYYLRSIGLLRPGIDIRTAKANTGEVAVRMALSRPDLHPNGADFTTLATPLKDEIVGPVSTAIWIVFYATGLLLAITCANVAGLLLVRSNSRMREVSVRQALGAGRRRIVRQLLTESALLAALGGVTGIGLAAAALSGLVAIIPADVPRFDQVRLDGAALWFSVALVAVAGLGFGAIPAFRGAGVSLRESFENSSARATDGRRSRVNRLLVVAQLAISMVLLVSAGLLARSFVEVLSVAPGFRTENVLTVRLSPAGKTVEVVQFYRELLDRVRDLPGVVSVGAANVIPLVNKNFHDGYEIEGQQTPSDGPPRVVEVRRATPGYFDAMGHTLLYGRTFSETDVKTSPLVAVIDQELARRHWPGGDAIGKRIKKSGEGPPWLEIIGVVATVHHEGLDGDAKGQFYTPLAQDPQRTMTIAMHSAGDAAALTGAVRELLREMAPELPLYDVQTIEQVVSSSLARRRFTVLALVVFASLALLLAAVGVYGIIAQSVSARVREIGVRMALGADRRSVLGMVFLDGLRLVAMGIAVGAAGALALSRVLENQLYGVTWSDPATFAGVALLLVATAAVSISLPARRAGRVDPMSALRWE